MANGFVKKRGARWYAVYPVPDPATGQTKKKWEVGGSTRAEAQRLLRQRMSSIDDGTYIDSSKLTLGEFLTGEWLPAIKAQVKPGTYEAYEQNLRLHVVRHIGGVPLQKVTAPTLNKLYANLLDHGRVRPVNGDSRLSAGTVGLVHNTLHTAFRDAVRWRRLVVNPADAAMAPRAEALDEDMMITWSADQLASFLDATADSRYLTAWLIASTTGLRRGELLGLKWDVVDLDVGTLRIVRTLSCIRNHVVPGTPKTKKSRRTLALDAHSVTVLRQWKTKRAEEKMLLGLPRWDEYVFCHPDGRFEIERRTVAGRSLDVVVSEPGCGPFHPRRFSAMFDSVVARLDLPEITFHGLRHTYATLGLEAGEHPRVMADRLGHSKTSITSDLYSHVSPRMDADLAERQARRIFGR